MSLGEATEEGRSDGQGAASDGADPVLAERLETFLRDWLGEWPPPSRFDVTSSRYRSEPGWDGVIRPVIGVSTPYGAVVSVVASVLEDARHLAEQGERSFGTEIGALVHLESARLVRAVFRYSERRVDLPDVGVWTPRDDRRVPDWLKPFNGDVLVAFAEDGSYAAGVGLKRHHPLGVELAVGTEPQHRNKGLAKHLVAQAARSVIDEGAVAIYLHAESNLPSAAVAEATGFPDRGWEVLGLFRTEQEGAAVQD
ncbi:MAG: GNAT family N-acetyltransferase [Acidimicrobiales bacterium]